MVTERSRERNENARRREAMATLAAAPGDLLSKVWRETGIEVEAKALRGPETGLVTLRGRIGGGGGPFNFGEATVTRATVKLPTGEIGHAYALGSDTEKARISATVDALWQRAEHRAGIEAGVLAPLRAGLAEADARQRAETAATKVDFFTMVRGED
ncbi:phosphonate C-P lyase system protein PhnG [Aquibium oceanicum]|uniref:Phosphonate C-P lyase system protein PhnG n=1 Tax=Aquibium oceanicum TaxID=1670800 RepID=A0A1L3SM86_9HYPH|nr:phosphonate C-P lyase system protein PhnG [Aquibium oceanicum]APH70518.1 phosphonate C-P lyase system protein PhnG [Aquibium oceanicum]